MQTFASFTAGVTNRIDKPISYMLTLVSPISNHVDYSQPRIKKMDKYTAQVFARLNTVLADAGILVTDQEKGLEVAKALGLVMGVRKVGGYVPTDLGLAFAGIDAGQVQDAKEHAKLVAENERLKAKQAAIQAKLAA